MSGPIQMAVDELLLAESQDGVLIRDYEWDSPTTSMGYFGESSDDLTILRRPTGGGIVEHGHGRDFTYSIVISAEEAKSLELSPQASYRAIHTVLADVLRTEGIPASTSPGVIAGDGGLSCFANPVDDDVLLNGEKIAGAGQKRSRGAILHQGSVQPVELPETFGRRFAESLAAEVVERPLKPELLEAARELATCKYASEAWNRRR